MLYNIYILTKNKADIRLLLSLLILLINCGCTNGKDKEVIKIYDRRQEILATFNKKSIFRTKTYDYRFLYTYQGDKRNEYTFTDKGEGYSLINEKIFYNPDSLLGIDRRKQNNIEYKEILINTLDFYLKKMDSFRINDISSEFSKQGIDLKIYMKPRGVLLYVANFKKVINPEWRKYIQSMRKLDNNWYYGNE